MLRYSCKLKKKRGSLVTRVNNKNVSDRHDHDCVWVYFDAFWCYLHHKKRRCFRNQPSEFVRRNPEFLRGKSFRFPVGMIFFFTLWIFLNDISTTFYFLNILTEPKACIICRLWVRLGYLSILNQMVFHLVQNRNENCHHDHIPFNLKGNRIRVFSVHASMTRRNAWRLLETTDFPIKNQNLYSLSCFKHVYDEHI